MGDLSFNQIVQTYRTNVHHTEFDASRAVKKINTKPHKILVMGIRLSTGTIAELIPKPILSADGSDAEAYFGVGSQIAQMCRAAKLNNPYSEMTACSIAENAAGTAGTKTLTVTGPATAAGTVHLYLDDVYIPVAVASGDANTAIATAINTAIQAHKWYSRLPWTSGVASNVVTLTKRWKGIQDEDARVNYDPSEALPAGVGVAVATGVTGATNPDVTSIFTAVGSAVQYDTVINPWTDATNLTAIETEGTLRFGGMVQMEFACYTGVVGSHATAVTLGTSRNSLHNRIIGANTSPSASYRWAAAFGAANALACQIDPAQPRQTVQLLGLRPAPRASQWSESQRNTLLYDGISTHVGDDGGNIFLETVITTYRLNAQSILDEAYLYAEGVDTLYAIRYDWRASVSLAFPRFKLADDGGEVPGQKIMTPKGMRGHAAKKYGDWSSVGWVEAGALQQFLDELFVARPSTTTERLSCQMSPNRINQFRGLDTQITFLL